MTASEKERRMTKRERLIEALTEECARHAPEATRADIERLADIILRAWRRM
jgi:hypothetical protein